MVAVKSIMTYSHVYVGVIMSAADELFLVRIHPACCRFTMGKFFFFFHGFCTCLAVCCFQQVV